MSFEQPVVNDLVEVTVETERKSFWRKYRRIAVKGPAVLVKEILKKYVDEGKKDAS